MAKKIVTVPKDSNVDDKGRVFQTFNTRFGFEHILRTYSGYDKKYAGDELLPVVILHGVQMGNMVHVSEGEYPGAACVLSYPEHRDLNFLMQSKKEVIPSCSPVLYGIDMWRSALKQKKRGKSIFFPMHTTQGARLDSRDWFDVVDQLHALPAELKPIDICLFPDDEDALFPFRDYGGFDVYTVADGDVYKKTYIRDLMELMAKYDYAFSDGVGSNLFYSIAMGIPYFVIGDKEPKFHYPKGNPFDIDLSDIMHRRKEEVREYFTEPRTDITKEQQDIADHYLRKEEKKSRKDLFADLEYARMKFFEWHRKGLL